MMDVYINDHLTMKLVCLPQHLTELVLGRLLTEQIITSSEDVDHIYICEYGKRAKVYLKNSARSTQSSSDAFVEVTPTCCTGNHILNDYFVTSKEPQSLTPIFWKPEWIFHMADAFADGSPLHGITFATHSCILAQKDMTLKVIHAGIPILSSKASPTSEAIDLAKKYHLTLICAARRDRMKVFTK